MLGAGFLDSNPGNSTFGQFANGSMASAQNPYFQQMANQTAASVLPQINSQFAAGNRMDSGLGARAEGLGLGSAIGNLAYQNYNQGLQGMLTGAQGLSSNYSNQAQQQLGTLGQVPNLNQMQLGNAAAGVSAGQQQQQLGQQQINDQIQRYNYGQQLPFSNLNNYMNLIQGNYGGTSNTSQPYFNNILGQLGAGAGGLGALYSSGIFGSGAGAAAGAGASGGLGADLAGMFAFA